MSVKLKPCPFCGSNARIVPIQSGFAIVCNDKNCLSEMRILYGSCDTKKMFLDKLCADWNRRTPEVPAVVAAIECIEDYRGVLHDEMQEPYDDHGSCCLDVLDETLNRLRCFTTSAAVEAWIRRAENAD